MTMSNKSESHSILLTSPFFRFFGMVLLSIISVYAVEYFFGDTFQMLSKDEILSEWSHQGKRIYIVYASEAAGKDKIKRFAEDLNYSSFKTTVAYFFNDIESAPDLNELKDVEDARKIHDYIWDGQGGKFREHCIAEFWRFKWGPDDFNWHPSGLRENYNVSDL